MTATPIQRRRMAWLRALPVRVSHALGMAPRVSADVPDTPKADSSDAGARLTGVVKRYGDTLALDSLDLRVPRGQLLGLLGPNGAGKTTTMHLLAGLMRPDAGRVDVCGAGSPVDRRTRRHVGLAPQALALYPQLTAEENLRFFARIHGVPKRELNDRVAWGLELADLGSRAGHRVESFSGGMQRRLNLASAALHRPRLLLLDEPTAGVDPQSRHHLYAAIRKLHAEDMTIVISTHLIDEAERLCDRVAIVDRGTLQDVGAPADLRRRHGSADLQGVLLHLTGQALRD